MWTIEDVQCFLKCVRLSEPPYNTVQQVYGDIFEQQGINGESLLFLNIQHLQTALKITNFGHAAQIFSKIEDLKVTKSM